MVSVPDVLQAVAVRGAASLDELERALPADPARFLQALDACVDHGYLRMALRRRGAVDCPYRLTARGRRALAAARRGLAAA